jgi:thioredoxin reductase (NADPH)
VHLVGHRWSERAHELKTFLTRNHVPYRWLDVERDAEGARLAELAGAQPADLPLVLLTDRAPLRAPTPLQVATALGLRTQARQPLYDLAIVGSGPAGLGAAVYAASEGLRTVLVEREAPGGQAGQSASIENYLGFPKGLSGADLTARAVAQAVRFGAEMVLAREVTGLETRGPVRAVLLEGAGEIEARAVLVAKGVSYRRLQADGVEAMSSRGVFYGASASDAAACTGEEVYVVGAANSAGQAALNLARHAKRVVMLVRGGSVDATMSHYLAERVESAPNLEVRTHTEVVAVHGDGHLQGLTLADRRHGSTEQVATSWLFVFIGASPRTDWLGEAVARDARASSSPGRTCWSPDAPARRGRRAARRTRWRPRCPGCSRPATSGWTA